MKRKSLFIFGIIGVLTLSIGFMKDFKSTEILAKEQPISENLFKGQADIDNGDQIRVVTVEEQNMVENSTDLSGFVSQENGSGFFFEKVRENNPIEDGDQYLVITAEEQNIVENSTALSGFVSQENGPGFFFEKVK
jgi:hypothetical protein